MSIELRTPVAKMSEAQREWFATAMVAMVLSDGGVSASEVDSLMQAISFVKNPQAAERLKKYVHFNAAPTLTPFHGWEREPRNRALILIDLMNVAIADRSFSPKEREEFHRIGTLLGFPGSRVDELIHKGEEFLERVEHAPGA